MCAFALIETQLRGLRRREHVQGATFLGAAAARAGTDSCRSLGSSAGGALTTATARRGRRGRRFPQRTLAAARTALCRFLHFADRDEVRQLFPEPSVFSRPFPGLVLLLEVGVVFPHDLHQVPALLLVPVTRKGGLREGEFEIREGGRGGGGGGCSSCKYKYFGSETRTMTRSGHAALEEANNPTRWGERTPRRVYGRDDCGPSAKKHNFKIHPSIHTYWYIQGQDMPENKKVRKRKRKGYALRTLLSRDKS